MDNIEEPLSNGDIDLGDEEETTRGGEEANNEAQKQASPIQMIPRRDHLRARRTPECFSINALA